MGMTRPFPAPRGFPFLGRGPERTGSVFFRNKSLIKRHPGKHSGLCLWFCTPNKRLTKAALNNSLFLRKTCEASWHFRCRRHASFIKVLSVSFCATAFSTRRSVNGSGRHSGRWPFGMNYVLYLYLYILTYKKQYRYRDIEICI